ncbi:hydroxyacid dehydrogenase [Patescibacteria group bacterium]|nr:hydroxyacid dehydrogenase [Patescibacteria group bacterium]
MEKPPFRILVTDPIHPDGLELLVQEGFAIELGHDIPKHELHKTLGNYDALICRTSTRLDKETLQTGTRLKCIGVSSTGFDHIDLKAASELGITVLGLSPKNKDIEPTKDGNYISTAEHTILLILSALGKHHHASQSMKEGRWEKHALIGRELYQKTVGIIGLGRIGRLVAERLHAFGAKVIWYDPFVSEDTGNSFGKRAESLQYLCEQSDILSIHVRGGEGTHHLLNKESFEWMKPGVVLINTSRASVVDEEALFENLKKGHVGHAAIDVFHNEPTGVAWELVRLPNVTATPHIGGSTEEAQSRIALNTARTLIRFIREQDRSNELNNLSL